MSKQNTQQARFRPDPWLIGAMLVAAVVVGPMLSVLWLACAVVAFLQYAGPLHGALRAATGWQHARDYWFPEVRSLGFCIAVLSAALYPYVYLLARAAFREQSGSSYEVARALGAGPWALGHG